ncbi:glycerol-3-phosphate acyltransferase [Nannochloropsis oceanica]
MLAATTQAFVLPTSRLLGTSSLKMMAAGTTQAGEKKALTVADVKTRLIEKITSDPNMKLPDQFQQALTDILDGMTEVAENTGLDPEKYQEMLGLLMKEAAENSRSLYQFEPFHKNIRGPVDFTAFGENFFDILCVKEQSGVLGRKNMAKIVDYVRQGHNVVLLANHQTEPDPYILRSAFKRLVPADDPLLDRLVFVAGAKVRTDLFTIPFSKGLNLICIHSKKYIEDDPATKPLKTQENLAAMKALQGLIVEGGHILWVAPSGGRDRTDVHTGKMAVAPFDSRAVDMFRVLSTKSQHPTHFFPLSMLTAQVLPPPAKVAMEVGERRLVARRPVHVYFGDELTPERVGSEFVARKMKDGTAEGLTEEELMKKAGKEGFTYVAEGDVKRHYDVLMGLDLVLEEEEVSVQYH